MYLQIKLSTNIPFFTYIHVCLSHWTPFSYSLFLFLSIFGTCVRRGGGWSRRFSFNKIFDLFIVFKQKNWQLLFFSSRHFRAWSLTQVPPFFPPPSFAGQQPANWQSSKGKEGRWRRSRRRRQAQSLTQKHWEEGAGLVVFSPPHTYFMKTDPPSSSIKDLP